MEIVRLPLGKQAPLDADCIRIEEQPHGEYKLSGSALCADADPDDSVTITSNTLFPTLDEAEATGLAWAQSVGVEHLFVSTGTQAQPLELHEIDRPL